MLLSEVSAMSANKAARQEMVGPIPVRVADNCLGRALFAVRQLGDLQLYTIWRFLGPQFSKLNGSLIDVGCGEMPFRTMLPRHVDYHGIDVAQAIDFKMQGGKEITTFDGQKIPFADASFDNALCTEVLEHAEHPEILITEMYRVLKRGGMLLATIPFSARVHYAPYDFNRFTRHRLEQMFADFADVSIEERGNDIATIANKLIVLCARLLKPSLLLPVSILGAIVVAPVAILFLAAAHVSILANLGSRDDPLGYAIRAIR
jgi:SAM-dependent methyltransferase